MVRLQLTCAGVFAICLFTCTGHILTFIILTFSFVSIFALRYVCMSIYLGLHGFPSIIALSSIGSHVL